MRRNINKLGLIGVMVLILLIVVLVSCRSKEISRDLIGKIALEEIVEYSDTVDFYIKQIYLNEVERLDSVIMYEASMPYINLLVTVTNKLDKSICLQPLNDLSSFSWFGIYQQEPEMLTDTIDFTTGFFLYAHSIVVGPKSSIEWTTSSGIWSIHAYYDDTNRNNTEELLNLVKRMKIYYIPPTNTIENGVDTVVIDRPYRVRTDANTKITSWSSL